MARIRRTYGGAICLTAAVLLAPTHLSGQTMRGAVADLETAMGLGGATILLGDVRGNLVDSAQSDARGEFTLAADAGTYVLYVRLIGYKPAEAPVELLPDATIDVRVNLVPQAVVLEPLIVLGEQLTQEQLEFESRRNLQYGFTFDGDSIANLPYAFKVEDVLDQGVPGGSTGRCYHVFLDGRREKPVSFAAVEFESEVPTTGSELQDVLSEYPLGWVYGIEVYVNYYDLPLKYRDLDPRIDQSCGAVLVWSNVTPQQLGNPQIWSFGGGLSPAGQLWALEIAWRQGQPTKYVTTLRARFGRYSPYDLLGTERADSLEYHPDLRPAFGSLYVGLQGPAPLLPWKAITYFRGALGATYYFGQQGGQVQEGDSLRTVMQISPFVGIGPELALGARVPSGSIRPWAEFRIGTEYFTNVKSFRLVGPVLTAGIEIGRLWDR